MKKMTLEECKKTLIDMLKYMTTICEQNKIEYTLIAGTLIGTIRHKGFIPWDDDIDIMMSRDNYNKFIQVIKKDNHKFYKIETWEDNDSYYYPFAKIIDKRTYVEEKNVKNIDGYGVYIDIFAFDQLPSKGLKLYYFKRRIYRNLLGGCMSRPYSKKTKLALIRNIRKYLINKFIGRELILKKYDQLCQKYNNSTKAGNYVMNCWDVYGRERETWNKSWFETFEIARFENLKVKIISDYDKILSQVYGNYMELPPIEKRISHGYQAFWKDNKSSLED